MLSTGEQHRVIVDKKDSKASTDRVEALRQILLSQDVRVDYGEAQEIGNSLIELFLALGEEGDGNERID